MTTIVSKIRILRTTAAAIAAETLEAGRIAYLTDLGATVVGDGVTVGASLPRIGGYELYGSPFTTTPTGKISIAYDSTVGDKAVCFGWTAVASGDASCAIGNLAVATGDNAFAFGPSVTADGDSAVALANASTATGFGSFATGVQALTSLKGQRSHAAAAYGGFPSKGSCQYTYFVLGNKTTDATPTTLFLDARNATDRLTIRAGTLLAGTATIAGIKSDGSEAALYVRKFAIKRISNTTSLVGVVETIGTDIEDDANWDVAVTADDTNDALDISVTGVAATTIRWVAHVQCVELAYGT